MAFNAKALGGRIKQLRLEVDLTQAALAERVGLETAYVSQIERGVRVPTVDVLDRIAAALKVSLVALFDGGKLAKEDALLGEVRALLSRWDGKQRRAVLNALRALAEL
jgi:transcriptional regulator with XRE-family HTH domain